jgi:hypothetical protein
MNAQARKSPVLFLAMCMAALILVTSACSFFTPRLGELSQTVDITLDEELFSQAKPTFKVHDHDFWEDLDVDVNRMELHDGYVRFLGTRTMPDGAVVDCSIDLRLGAEKGMLTARIIGVDIPGIKLTDPRVVEINQEMETRLSFVGYSTYTAVLFREVEVTEDALRLKVEVDIRF